jgi:putative DNA methylase
MRMIERWFPCAEVSEASAGGWGSGKSERALFTWFAARPLAQAKAAVLTSLLPWPEDTAEQQRLQDLVRAALTGRDAAHDEVVAELARFYPDGASVLDPFSGRAMIPLEAARLGVRAWGIDYSPVATLAGSLLADYPLRNWSNEPELPLGSRSDLVEDRLVSDVKRVLDEVGRRYEATMATFYPKVNGKQPWGYGWAVTLPCQECGKRFPITGSLVLRHPLAKTSDPGQSYSIDVDRVSGTFRAQVHDGPPRGSPTLAPLNKGGKIVTSGRPAVCSFCEHVHPVDVHRRMSKAGLAKDALLIVADIDERVGKSFREPTGAEVAAAAAAAEALSLEPPFSADLPAVPNEPIPLGNTRFMSPLVYGAATYGDLCNARQTLGFVRLCRIVNLMSGELLSAGVSQDYTAALSGYAAAVIVRKLRLSTRGAPLKPRLDPKSNRVYVSDVFQKEAHIAFSYDHFESGLGDGPGTWASLIDDTVAVLKTQRTRAPGRPATIRRGSAMALPLRTGSISAAVMDPPYDEMIPYADISDVFYVWLKRALLASHPDLSITTDLGGLQEKVEEIIVKRTNREAPQEHRTSEFYDASIGTAFSEAARVVRDDGVVTIVFGHGEPDVWHRLLAGITRAGLVLTGSWPARTESGGSAGSANIVTTLTLACRPAPPNRPAGRAADVAVEVRREVRARVPLWERARLALTDQLMASAGPAMEVVGRYADVRDHKGEPVSPIEHLKLARRVVEEAAAIQIESLPLDTFDVRTRFALFWSRLFGRAIAPKSEARWQAMASDLSLPALDGILVEAEGGKGMRLAYAKEVLRDVELGGATIDVAFALARAVEEGLAAAGDVLAIAGRDADDSHLWAALTYLSAQVPENDPDRQAWSQLVRARSGLAAAARSVVHTKRQGEMVKDSKARQGTLFPVESEE